MSENAVTTTTTRDDGKYVRTALVLDDKGLTFDLVRADGTFVSRVNVFSRFDDEGDWLAVDVIDVDDRFDNRRVLSFKDGVRNDLDTGTVAAVDFRKEV